MNIQPLLDYLRLRCETEYREASELKALVDLTQKATIEQNIQMYTHLGRIQMISETIAFIENEMRELKIRLNN